ncbi:FAD-dependent monooxygenase [Devosia pacifica]|nr:FAD-dependent monooxygenase [Devosia pacifica]
MADTKVDVAILGGGPAGLTMALALSRYGRGLRVAIVERRDMTIPKDSRATAIAAGVRRVFDALDIWQPMAERAQPITAMRITDSAGEDIARPLFLSFSGDVAPGEAFAHMVPNAAMAEALLAAVDPSITLLAPAQVHSFDGKGGRARLGLADGSSLEASLVIAADGAQSSLRDMAGIGVFRHDYGQSGIVTTIAHALDHEGVAYEHFRPSGPFASLPLPGKRSSLVWTERSENVGEILGASAEQQAERIEAVMGSTLGAVRVEETVMSFPLRLQLAHSFIGPRLALIGDAAHVVHPIAGQGLNLGLKDVAALAEVIIDAARLGLDIGTEQVLERYQRWRRFDTATMAMVTDGMNRLFSNDVGAIRALRDLGLGLVDRTEPIKDAMIRAAASVSPNGPKLLNGAGL